MLEFWLKVMTRYWKYYFLLIEYDRHVTFSFTKLYNTFNFLIIAFVLNSQVLNGNVAQFYKLSSQIGGDVDTQVLQRYISYFNACTTLDIEMEWFLIHKCSIWLQQGFGPS